MSLKSKLGSQRGVQITEVTAGFFFELTAALSDADSFRFYLRSKPQLLLADIAQR